LWKELDRNGDGYLDVDEIKSFLCQYYSEEEDTVVDEGELEKSAQRMLRFADLNRDGRISRDEFDELVSDLEYVVRGNLIGYWTHLAIAF
jgi:Ca2+-binding EF-hand superfamily protein